MKETQEIEITYPLSLLCNGKERREEIKTESTKLSIISTIERLNSIQIKLP